jgi:2-polyprenyl-6-hydroxyphenyl methylase/3-demethylubiquinone-9 3-methyltransferase
MRGDPSNWEVRDGSILDPGFAATIEPADIVYSWGVLHHTGRMYDAIRNAAGLVPGGCLRSPSYNDRPVGLLAEGEKAV